MHHAVRNPQLRRPLHLLFRLLLIVAILFGVAACQRLIPATAAVQPTGAQNMTVDKSLLQPCAEFAYSEPGLQADPFYAQPLYGGSLLLSAACGVVGGIWLAKRRQQQRSNAPPTLRVIRRKTRSYSVARQRSSMQSLLTELEASNRQLAEEQRLLIRAFFHALEQRESGTASHSLRVQQLSLEIGRNLNLKNHDLQMLKWGTLLHDIGKLTVGDAVLLKAGPLTDEERQRMEQHPKIGFTLLKDFTSLQDALVVVRYHHERFDGRGYPYQLAADAIPLLARICAVADAFDAMTSDRPYRKGLSAATARNELELGRGTQFDPQIVDAFLQLPCSRLIEAAPSCKAY